MGDEIKYNFEAISNLTGGMLTKWNYLNDQLELVKSAIDPLVSTWDGKDSAAYQLKQAEWNSAQTELNSVLQSLIGSVNSGNQRMIEQEAMNRARFES